ncbi:MAG: glycosyltransferase family 1 protein [Vicinamibacterales bacterium]
MRIAIDARKLHDYGIGTYVRNVLRFLGRIDAENEYILLCRPADCDVVRSFGDNFRSVAEPSANYSIAEQIRLPGTLKKAGADVFHAPHYVLPPFLPCPSVVTIHDCIHLVFPQYLPNKFAHFYARTFMTLAARRSARILTVSEASKRDILHFFHVPASKVEVVYNALDPAFDNPPEADDVVRVRQRFQLNDPFLLYAGNIKPHKNVDRVIEAFARLKKRGFENLKLVIIGDEISKYPQLRRAVHRHQLHKHVRFLGFVPDATLAILYRLADVFVFPSLYEGFGLPPLEAMASGTPVVTSNVSSLPEVVGDAALLVDPHDAEAIAAATERILTDGPLRRSLVQKGLARAHDFSWERSVRRIRDVYLEVGAK